MPLTICNGRGVNDKKAVGKMLYYKDDKIATLGYHIANYCQNKTNDGNICKTCSEKKIYTEKCISEGKLSKNNNFVGVKHPHLYHGRKGEPIPLWSHIEDGIWDKANLLKGYSKEMTKTPIDENKLYQFIATLKGKKDGKVEAIMKEFPIAKSRAAKYIADFNKNGLPPSAPPTKIIVVSREKEEAFDIVEVHVKKIEVGGKSYLYEPMKSKVYTLEYDYVGRYDSKEKRIFTEYPDSDAEPVLN